MRIGAVLIAAFLLGPGFPARGETGVAPPQQQLESVRRELAESAKNRAELDQKTVALDQEVAALRPRLTEAAAAVDKSESLLDELESGLADLEGESVRRATALGEQRREMSRTLARLQRVALVPAATNLLSPAPPLDRLRTDLALQTLLPHLQKQGHELAAMVQDMRHLKATLTRRRADVLRQRAVLAGRQETLDTLMRTRIQQLEAARRQRQSEEDKAARLAAEATSLQDLVARLEREHATATTATTSPPPPLPPAPPAAPRPTRESQRRLPVTGSTLVAFGQRDPLGATSKGVTLRPRPGAPVVAVAAGRVAFAGPFRGYGRILILEHARGYHTVIAGLADVSVGVGERIEAGEPLGRMGTATDPPPQLYFEVRRSGTPVDPLGAAALALTSGP